MTTVYRKQKPLNAPHTMLLPPATLINKRYSPKHEVFHACASILKPLTNRLQSLLVVYLVKLRLTSFKSLIHCNSVITLNANVFRKCLYTIALVHQFAFLRQPYNPLMSSNTPNWMHAKFWHPIRSVHVSLSLCYLFLTIMVKVSDIFSLW